MKTCSISRSCSMLPGTQSGPKSVPPCFLTWLAHLCSVKDTSRLRLPCVPKTQAVPHWCSSPPSPVKPLLPSNSTLSSNFSLASHISSSQIWFHSSNIQWAVSNLTRPWVWMWMAPHKAWVTLRTSTWVMTTLNWSAWMSHHPDRMTYHRDKSQSKSSSNTRVFFLKTLLSQSKIKLEQ